MIIIISKAILLVLEVSGYDLYEYYITSDSSVYTKYYGGSDSSYVSGDYYYKIFTENSSGTYVPASNMGYQAFSGSNFESDRFYYNPIISYTESSGTLSSFASGVDYYEVYSPSDAEEISYTLDFNQAYYLTEDFWAAVNDNAGDFEEVLKAVVINNSDVSAISERLTMTAGMTETLIISSDDSISINGSSYSDYSGAIYKSCEMPLISYDASGNLNDNGFRKWTILESSAGSCDSSIYVPDMTES